MIRQRDTARPEDQPDGPAQPMASIAPDDLEAFARDLRALRAKADLDYPEMAETSHFEMKTLAAAAGGLRLPTLPVTVAFVRACGGNVAEDPNLVELTIYGIASIYERFPPKVEKTPLEGDKNAPPPGVK